MDPSKKYTTIHYHKYLELDKLLDSQKTRSGQFEDKAAHEEMLFIIVHQVYELWFKQIIHEITSVCDMFRDNQVDEKNLGVAVSRLDRVEEILKLTIQQIGVLETMTPLDFLDFRNYLFPASGFQSYQFRIIESMLGLREKDRMTYNGHSYKIVFTEDQQAILTDVETRGSLFELIENWLERIPFLNYEEFNFLDSYSKAVNKMLAQEQKAIEETDYLSDKMKAMRLKMLGGTNTYFKHVLSKDAHDEMLKSGEIKLSYKATISALLIKLYRDHPILQMPYRLITNLTDIDELLTTWRYRHAQMVKRMIGNKVGTGGSSGHDYLVQTAEKHKIFNDFHNISSLLIPRSELPDLPANMIKELGFYYSEQSNNNGAS